MFDPWVQEIPWRRAWLLTPVFLPGESHGQSLVGYSPWGHKQLDTIEQPGTQDIRISFGNNSPCLFNFYAEYIMRNTELEETQAGIKIAGRNINNLRYTNDTTLMAESKVELKSLLMKVKEESKNWLKTQHSKKQRSWHLVPSLNGK